MKALKYSIIVILFLPMTAVAQKADILQFKWQLKGQQKPICRLNQSASILINTGFVKTITPVQSLQDIKYNLPKGAIFCRMEDALHSKFNFWFKVRMGCDDKYSN